MKYNAVEGAIKVNLLELISLPLFLYTFSPDRIFFWIILIALDSYMVKNLNVMQFGKEFPMASKKAKEIYMVVNIGILLGYLIIFIKNVELLGLLISNEIVMYVLSVFLYLKSIKKEGE